MDRRLAERNLRAGLLAAAIAAGSFATAFVAATFFIG